MKYFNKQWYELMQKQFMTDDIKELPDKEYSEEEIEELYNQELKNEIERAREEYNTPPDYSILEELINDEEPFNPENWIIVSDDDETTFVPTSKEEVIENLSKEKEKSLEEFNNRPPFNEKEVIDYFEQSYKIMLKYQNFFPNWVYEKVDIRLIALNLLPKSVLEKLRIEENENYEKFNKIIEESNKDKNKVDVFEGIFSEFNFHDDKITNFEKQENSYVMTIENYEGKIIKIVFEDAEIIEYEKLDLKNCFWLYEEVYSQNDTYEVHLMVESDGLKYITLKCKEIKGI